jgi:hypothetical protein
MKARLLLGTLALAACGPGVTPSPQRPKPAAGGCQAALTGRWEEEFIGRHGCSDVYTFAVEHGAVQASGADCNDNRPYVFEELSWGCRELHLRILVPLTRYRVSYEMRPVDERRFDGEAVVTQPDGTANK